MAKDEIEELIASIDYKSLPKVEIAPWYNPFGDCVHFQIEDVLPVEERKSDLLTIYRSPDTNKVIGFQIKGIRSLATLFGITYVAVEGSECDGEFTVNSLSISSKNRTFEHSPTIPLDELVWASCRKSREDEDTSELMSAGNTILNELPIKDQHVALSS